MALQPDNLREHVSLARYSTMRLGGEARYFAEVRYEEELKNAVAWAKEQKLPMIMLGGGSNTVITDAGFAGLVIINRITGLRKGPAGVGEVLVTAGSGEIWDDLVAYTVEQGLSGLETLSLVPGTVGAAPMQNIGAYGMEIDQVLEHLEALDLQTDQVVSLTPVECGFSYRSSWLQTKLKGRYFIMSVTFRLQDFAKTLEMERKIKPPYYTDIADYLAEHPVAAPTPQVIRDAVIAIRKRKLPDVATVATSGSFFGNPILDAAAFEKLVAEHPALNEPGAGYTQKPYWPMPDGRIKVSAGRLIEMSGMRGWKDAETGMAISDKQALVVINEHAESAADLFRFRQKIVDRVYEQWGIILEQEPETIGAE